MAMNIEISSSIGDIGDMRKPRASWTHAAGHQKKGDIGEAGR